MTKHSSAVVISLIIASFRDVVQVCNCAFPFAFTFNSLIVHYYLNWQTTISYIKTRLTELVQFSV